MFSLSLLCQILWVLALLAGLLLNSSIHTWIFQFKVLSFLSWFLVYSVKDFFSEEQPKNYKDMYKNFAGFINTLNSSLLVELDGKNAAAAAAQNVMSSSSINRYFYAGF